MNISIIIIVLTSECINMSTLVEAEIAATCNALGYFDTSTNKYYTDENVLETLKDLIRYLRRDNESFDVRRQLGETKVLQTDLLPLLKNYWEDDDMFDVVLRLLVNLTTPPLILWNEEVPTEKITRNHYLQIEEHLQNYKQAFTDDAIWALLSTKLSKILELEYAERGDENGLVIERILILVRNILYVPSDPDTEKRPDHDANLHDQVLWALRQSGMLDIILYISGSPMEQVYYMHILEILSFMLREQVPSQLATSALERNHTEKLRDEAQLLAIRHQENVQKRQKVRQFTSARHSRFGGTFVVKSMKSIGDNELIYHKPLNTIDKISFDVEKTKLKTPKNRQPIKDKPIERHSAFSVRLFLKEFCIEFLNGAYNTMMHEVKNTLVRAKAQAHDESYYLWALRFFMEFNRTYKFEVKLVSETVSIPTFHFVQQQMERYFDMLSSDKKKVLLWSKRLHLALLAYKELLLTIAAMDSCTEQAIKESAKVIKSNIFYVIEYRELVLTLLITFDELKMSDIYLKDLIETQHIFLKMLQKFCANAGTVVVEEKKKRKRKKTKSKVREVTATAESIWDEISLQLPAILAGQVDQNVVPYDASSETPIDEQKADAVKNIHTKLREKNVEEAVALLRAAREVWPENDTFGNATVSPDEEYLILQEIFFTDLPNVALTANNASDGNETDNEEEEAPEAYSENYFKFEDFVKRLAHPKIVRGCSLCLRNFNRNSIFTNNCVVKLLHRIAFDCKMYVMLFQASIFRTFQSIFALKAVPQHKELVKFATYIMRQFFAVAAINPKVYIEVLFWKSSKDAFDISHGYGSYQQKSQAALKAWTEVEEQQLQVLFDEHQQNGVEEDVVDWITRNLIENNRSRRGVLKKLKEMNLLTNYKKQNPKKQNQPWSVEEETELREVFEQFRDADDPLDAIITNLSVVRPKNRIIEKLLVMGVIQDKSELKNKRKRKSRTNTDQNAPSTSRKRNPTARKVTKSRKKPTKVALTEFKKLLQTIKDSDSFSDALQWISESFSEAADDLETINEPEADGGIPLVPLFESYETALENDNFKKMLECCNILQPADEQETYWRIPNNIPPADLRQYAALINDVLNGTLSLDDEEANKNGNAQENNLVESGSENDSDASQSDVNDTDSDDEVRNSNNRDFDALKEAENVFKSGSVGIISDVQGNSNAQDINLTESRNENDSHSSQSDANDTDSDSEHKSGVRNRNNRDSDARNVFKSTNVGISSTASILDVQNRENVNANKTTSRIRRISDSDDDNDTEQRQALFETESAPTEEENDDKRGRSISDSDSDQPRRKKTRLIISSDEEE